jgi:hypothetical protein
LDSAKPPDDEGVESEYGYGSGPGRDHQVTIEQRRGTWHWTAVAAVALGVSCAQSASRHEPAPASTASRTEPVGQNIDHVSPARDSIIRAASRFAWTPIQGADSYSIGIWNEVDVLVWRQNNVPTTSVTMPADVQLEPGTYFWSVSALRNGQEVADSGLAAFVVRTTP